VVAKKRCKIVKKKKHCKRFEASVMPCGFRFLKGNVLVDILHLLVRGNPGPILHAVGSKSDRRCVLPLANNFHVIFLLWWQEAIFIEAIESLLSSAKALPTLCMKASAQKASHAKVQKSFKIKGFLKCALRELNS
jgi:hypothetical protein